jgi:hypothetical protein
MKDPAENAAECLRERAAIIELDGGPKRHEA